MNRLAVIGSTGSIGRSTLAVAEAHPDRLRIVALAAGENASLLADQVARFAPAAVAMASDTALQSLDRELSARGTGRRPLAGAGGDGLVSIVDPSRRRHRAVRLVGHGQPRGGARRHRRRQAHRARQQGDSGHGRRAGDGARRAGASVEVLPVDSEHNAIHQCLHGRELDDVRRLILTASGGPFRGLSAAELAGVTPDDALRHPTWNMGPKITIDSATLMNKGLEVIEARWLFDVGAGAHFRRRASAIHRPFDGRVRRRLDRGAARRYRYAIADTVCALVSGAMGRARCRRST